MFTFSIFFLIDKLFISNYNYLHEVKNKKMDTVESIPLSSLVAGMMLCRGECISLELAQVLSDLECMGIVIDEENDDFSKLSCCVEMSSNCCFQLKRGLDYDSVLDVNITVFEFLMIYTNEFVLSFLKKRFSIVDFQSNCIRGYENQKLVSNEREVTSVSKKKILSNEKNRKTFRFFKVLSF